LFGISTGWGRAAAVAMVWNAYRHPNAAGAAGQQKLWEMF
jgi:hypothetical protein